MPDRPDALELLEAVRGFLETEVAKGATDARLRFRALVAANALSIAGRELMLDPASSTSEARILRELLGEAPSGAPPSEEALARSEEHTSELQSPCNLVCRLLLEKKNR